MSQQLLDDREVVGLAIDVIAEGLAKRVRADVVEADALARLLQDGPRLLARQRSAAASGRKERRVNASRRLRFEIALQGVSDGIVDGEALRLARLLLFQDHGVL